MNIDMRQYSALKRCVNTFRKNFKKTYSISYSQCGEDLIVNFIFKVLKIEKPTYIDIGAHHPEILSNTYLLYKNGSRGVCVEPDPILFEKIKKERPKDICLNIGIGSEEIALADFYIMSTKVLSTFSKKEASYLSETTGKKIEKVIKIPLLPIDMVLERYFNNKIPNFVSLDTEGYDFAILKSLDFQKFRPEVFCIETLTYTENKTEEKETEMIEFMITKGYFPYADTYINTIFVDKSKWLNRQV